MSSSKIDAPRIARLTLLAAGLTVGPAMAAPWVASADSAFDATEATAAVGAAADSLITSAGGFDYDPTNFAVSIDGLTLFHSGTATANSTLGNIAIADGAHSNADATGRGTFDFAYADGVDSQAEAGQGVGNFDSASAFGTDAVAKADVGNFGTASASGAGSYALVDFGGSGNLNAAFADGQGAFANAGGTAAGPGSFDLASAVGTNTTAAAEVGNFDQATAVDPFGTTGSYASALLGTGNVAIVLGDGDLESAGGSPSLTNSSILGNDDFATIVGNNDIADAGANLTQSGNFDLAADFGNMLDANATGANFLVDIMPTLGM